MTRQECDFAMAHLDELAKLIQPLEVLHGLQLPVVLERYGELLSRLTDDAGSVEFLEIRQFLDWAEGMIIPVLRDLPEYQKALRDFLAACRVSGPIE
jgi:hypothetical protein